MKHNPKEITFHSLLSNVGGNIITFPLCNGQFNNTADGDGPLYCSTCSEWIELSRCLNLRGQGWRPGETVEILDSSALFWLITVRFTVIDLK